MFYYNLSPLKSVSKTFGGLIPHSIPPKLHHSLPQTLGCLIPHTTPDHLICNAASSLRTTSSASSDHQGKHSSFNTRHPWNPFGTLLLRSWLK
ncbi:hypothetical protein HanPSC8_Chr06g0255551 [Helianthus annuus]|nr:hypothetical protein HanPSC8_Chr06g0255551 [Helianthus annuus]